MLTGGVLHLATYVPDNPASDAAGPPIPQVEARTYYNPLEYLKPLVPASVFQAQVPEIADVFIEAAPAAGMAGTVKHDYDLATGEANPPASVEHVLRATIELDAHNDAAANGPTVAPFSITYEMNRLTLDNAGNITARDLRSRERAAMSQMRPDNPIGIATALYDVSGSSVAADRYRIRLPIDVELPGFSGDPDWKRATDAAVTTEMDTDILNGADRNFGYGDYELKLTVADVWGAPTGDAIRTIRFVIEPALVFVRDRQGNNVVDHTDPHIDHAQVGHWGDDTTAGLPGVDGYDAMNKVFDTLAGGTFIENDPERFYLRVRDFAANEDAAVKDTVSANIGSLKSDGTIDDDMNAVVLVETGINTGIFVSAGQLLMGEDVPVADNPDDDYAVHDGVNLVLNQVADDLAGDRTHRVTVDGKVRAEYTPTPAPLVRSDIDVCDRDPEERRVLQIQVRNVLEPFNNTGYDPDGAAGPLGVTGAGNMTPGANPIPIFDFDDVNGNGMHDQGNRLNKLLTLL